MSSTETAATLLSQVRLCSSGKERLKLLYKVKGLIVDKEPDLLDNFLDEMIDQHQYDESPAVRKFVVYFILSACNADAEVIPRVLNNLTALLADDNINVAKDAIRAFGALYRFAVVWLAGRPLDDTHNSTWSELNDVRDMVFTLVESDNDGLRTNLIKVFESVIVTLSTASKQSEMARNTDYDMQFSIDRVPEMHKLLSPSFLKLQAEQILTQLLTFVTSSQISVTNLVTALHSLTMIARQRPQFMVRIINTIQWIHDVQLTKEKLGQESGTISWKFHAYQEASLKKCLKLQLLSLLVHNSSKSVRPFIVKILLGKWLKCEEKFVQKFLPSGTSIASVLKASTKKSTDKDKKKSSKASGKPDEPQLMDDDDQADPELDDTFSQLPEQFPQVKLLSTEEKVEITRQALVQTLNVENVTNIVLLSTVYLPDSIPEMFRQEYKPIGEITVAQQRENVALLLARLMTSMNIGEGAEKNKKLQEKVDEQRDMRNKSMPSVTARSGGLKKQHSIDRKHIFIQEVKKSKTVKNLGKSSAPRKVKPWSLTSAAKKLSLDDKEVQSEGAVTRILRAKQKPSKPNAVQEYSVRLLQYKAASQLHTRLVSRLVSQFGGQLHEDLLDFLMQDPKQIPLKLELCLQWLYDEFQMSTDIFEHDMGRVYNEESNYNTALCTILKMLIENGAGLHPATSNSECENIFTHVALRAPILTKKSWKMIAKFCSSDNSQKLTASSFLLQQLAKRRVTNNYDHIAEMTVELCTQDQSDMIRIHTINEMTKIYQKAGKKLRIIIENKCIEDWLVNLKAACPPHKLLTTVPEDEMDTVEWSDDMILRCLAYFLAIVPISPNELLLELAYIFSSAQSQLVQRAILRAIGPAVQQVGLQSDAILNLIKTCPNGAEMMVIRILHILTEDALSESTMETKKIPSEVIKEVKALYKREDPLHRDVRYLIPVLAFLSYDEIVEYLPKIIYLPDAHIRDAICRIAKSPNISPPDLLVELNMICQPDGEKDAIEAAIRTMKICFLEKSVCTSDIMAQTIQKLTDSFELDQVHKNDGTMEIDKITKRMSLKKYPPTLTMRTMIQTLVMYPKLSTIVVSCLSRMAKSGKLERYNWLLEGFIQCISRLKHQAFDLLLALDFDMFERILERVKGFRGPLHRYVEQPQLHRHVQVENDKRVHLLKIAKQRQEKREKKEKENQSTTIEPKEKKIKLISTS